jgi:hypothetical protein
MNIPTKDELVEFDGLDERCVVKHFLGKTSDQAYDMFRSGSHYCEDLMWMSPRGLQYYLPPAIRYLESEESRGDFEFVSGTMTSLSIQVTQNQLSASLVDSIRSLISFVRSNLVKFGVEDTDEFILGRIETIEKTLC